MWLKGPGGSQLAQALQNQGLCVGLGSLGGHSSFSTRILFLTFGFSHLKTSLPSPVERPCPHHGKYGLWQPHWAAPGEKFSPAVWTTTHHPPLEPVSFAGGWMILGKVPLMHSTRGTLKQEG